MSKQSAANTVYLAYQGSARKIVIEHIVEQLGVSTAYASTLYNNARKAVGSDKPATKKPSVEVISGIADKVTRFDRPTLRTIRGDVEKALADVASKYGININVGAMSYNDAKFTTKLTATTGSQEDAAQREWNLHAWRFNLKENQVGTEFTFRGATWTVTGIKPRSKRYPILAENASGTVYKFPASVLKA